MRLTVTVTIDGESQKGSDMGWVENEGARLKNVLAAKRVKDEQAVQEHQFKINNGQAFWQTTRQEIKRLLEELNENAGAKLFHWRSAKSDEIHVESPELGKNCSLMATFRPEAFSCGWRCFNYNREFTLFVERGTLLWNDGSENLTAAQAAQHIVSEFTRNIL